MEVEGRALPRRRMFGAIAALAATTAIPITAAGQAFDIGEQAKQLRDRLPEEMTDPVVRFGLVEFAYAFRFARIEIAPLGYEKSENFQRISSIVVEGLQKVLSSAPTLEPLHEEFIQTIETAYQKNLGTTKVVYARVREVVRALVTFSDDEITAFQLRISIILNSAARDLWKEASSVTCAYPFC